MKRALAACLLGCFCGGVALAVPVGPGQTVTYQRPGTGEDPVPPGVQIASQTIHFTADITSLSIFMPGFEPDQTKVDGTVANSVWRDSSGKLTFVYDFTFPTVEGRIEYVDNFDQLAVSNYAGFSTDFVGQFGDTVTVDRSADGKTVTGTAGNGNGSPPLMILTTDATNFNRGGTATFIGVTDFVPGHNAEGQTGVLDVRSTANLSGLYQPAESAAAVPLPPAVFGGSALLGLIFLAQRKRLAHA